MSASSSELKWVDNHCHFEENDEVALDLQEAANKGVEKFIVVGLMIKELKQLWRTEKNKDIFKWQKIKKNY